MYVDVQHKNVVKKNGYKVNNLKNIMKTRPDLNIQKWQSFYSFSMKSSRYQYGELFFGFIKPTQEKLDYGSMAVRGIHYKGFVIRILFGYANQAVFGLFINNNYFAIIPRLKITL